MKINLKDDNRGGPETIPIAPVIEFPVNSVETFKLSPTDPDGREVKCRKTTSADSGIPGIAGANFYGMYPP